MQRSAESEPSIRPEGDASQPTKSKGPGLTRRVIRFWASLGPSVLPFADVATPDLPLSRLLRLSLFQVSVAMTMVLLVGTLNRVMIVELKVSSALVGIMISLPLVAAPFRALIGFRSDTHQSELGWRRVPFIWKGTMAQFCGYAIMPFALLVLAGSGPAANMHPIFGICAAALAFAVVGAGAHMVQTAGLALATDLTPAKSHPKVVGLMYVMLLFGMMASALAYGVLLEDFSAGRLIQVIQGTAVVVMLLNGISMWKQEVRRPLRGRARAPDPSFIESWRRFCEGPNVVRRLVVVGIGTMAFGLADVVLEPFGGQVLSLSVSSTTKLTALWAVGGITGFAVASRVLEQGTSAYRVCLGGLLTGLPAFVLVLSASVGGTTAPFLVGNFFIGFGGALFGHGTLTAAMDGAPEGQAGLAIGAWGAVQATAAGLAMALSGTVRDVVDLGFGGLLGKAGGYNTVYGLEIVLLLVTVVAVLPLLRDQEAEGKTA